MGDYPHTRTLGQALSLSGYELEVSHPALPAAFRSMVRHGAFDVCEMAMTTVIAALRYPQDFVAIPAFLVRSMPFGSIVSTRAREPQGLEGGRVGVRAITGTAVFWVRGILSEGYGLDQNRVTWVTTDEDYIAEVCLPPNVASSPGGDLSEMLENGDVVAAINPSGPLPPAAKPLWPDPAAEARRWLERTGIYPLNHVVVVSRACVQEDPELPEKLLVALQAARAASPPERGLSGIPAGEFRNLVGGDLLPYGVEANRHSLEAAIRMAVDQGILNEIAGVEELFAPGTAQS